MGCAQSKATCLRVADEPTTVVVGQPVQTPVQVTVVVRPDGCTRMSDRYVALAHNHTGDGLVTLPDGRQLDKRGVYLQAICLNARCGVAYFNLALMIESLPNEFITLLDGRKLNARGLYLEAINYDTPRPTVARAYYPWRVRTTILRFR
jgi:hypothetical protein